MNPKFAAYAHPEALVDGDWLQEHLQDPSIRIVESNEDVLLYDTGHYSGRRPYRLAGRPRRTTRCGTTSRRKNSPKSARKMGSTCQTTVVFYGDKSNWWACYALWAFRLFGHDKVKVLDGGRDKVEGGEPSDDPETSRARPRPIIRFRPPGRTPRSRAFFEDALAYSKARKPLIDVRSPKEYTGETTHMPEYPQEGVLRGGHIPGARSVPWKTAANDDGTFKTAAELKKIYTENLGLKPDSEIVAYCRIGERSSHTWFVLTYLLGYGKVRNYDGSWTEWGNRVRAPVAKGDQPG